jgi:hypothetical protein
VWGVEGGGYFMKNMWAATQQLTPAKHSTNCRREVGRGEDQGGGWVDLDILLDCKDVL